MSRVAVITAIYDQYDTLKPPLPQRGVEVDWVLVTDQPPADALGWRVVHEPRPEMHPNRAAKAPKYEPWRYTDADASIWVDASFRIVSERFAAEALAYAEPIAQFRHPWRDCLYEEAAVSAGLSKYRGEPITAQADHYRHRGHPASWGLWASGVIARHHTPDVMLLGRHWAAQTRAWSFQDQISQPYCLRITGLRPALLPGFHIDTPWLRYEASRRH